MTALPRRQLLKSLGWLLLAACTPLPPLTEELPHNPTRTWQDEIIYQLLTDRFARGPGDPVAADSGYHGGTWAGITSRLDYLKALGVTAIWISPVVENTAGGYHGYWTAAFDKHNPEFGTREELHTLVDAAHAHGMRVIFDFVLNHTGPVFFYDLDGDGKLTVTPELNEFAPAFGDQALSPAVFTHKVTPAPFQDPTWYHRRGQITDWQHAEQVLLGDFKGGLRDLATERADVREAVIESIADWVEEIPFDGIRYDAVKHVDPELWEDLLSRTRAIRSQGERTLLQTAEVFDGSLENLAAYLGENEFDSVLDFAGKYQIYRDVFLAGGPTTLIAAHDLEKARVLSESPQRGGIETGPRRSLMTFLDNHDVPRFLGEAAGNRKLLHAALGYLLTSEGIPTLYYGTEQDFDGMKDPENREDLWSTGYSQDSETFSWISRLATLRNESSALRRGLTRFVWQTTHVGEETDAGVIAFERYTATERLLIVINTQTRHASRTRYAEQDDMLVGFAPGSVLIDLLEPSSVVTVSDRGSLDVEVGPGQVRVLSLSVPE